MSVNDGICENNEQPVLTELTCAVVQDVQPGVANADASIDSAPKDNDTEENCSTLDPLDDTHLPKAELVDPKAELVDVPPSSRSTPPDCAVDIDLTLEEDEVQPVPHCFPTSFHSSTLPAQDCSQQKDLTVHESSALASKSVNQSEAILRVRSPLLDNPVVVDLTAEENNVGSSSTVPSLIPQMLSHSAQYASITLLNAEKTPIGLFKPVAADLSALRQRAGGVNSTSDYAGFGTAVSQSSADTTSDVKQGCEPDSLRAIISGSSGALKTQVNPSFSSGSPRGNQSDQPAACTFCGIARSSRNEPRLRRMMCGKVWTLTDTYRYVMPTPSGRKRR